MGNVFSYVKFSQRELLNLIYYVFTISIGFSLFYFFLIIKFFSKTNSPFSYVFFITFLFIFIFLFTRILFMKFIAYTHAFELTFENRLFNQYGIAPWQNIKTILFNPEQRHTTNKFKGFSFNFLTILISTTTFGIINFPLTYKYTKKKILSKHIGKFYFFEIAFDNVLGHVAEISDFRVVRVIFSGFFWFFLSYLFVNFFFFGTEFFGYFFYILTYLGIFYLLKIPSSEGFEMLKKERGQSFLYTVSVCFIFLGLFLNLFLSSIFLILFLSSILIVLWLFFYIKKTL